MVLVQHVPVLDQHVAHAAPACRLGLFDLAVEVIVQHPEQPGIVHFGLVVHAMLGCFIGPAVAERGEQHLLPGLFAPGDVDLRVRIGRVALGIVVDVVGDQLRAGRNLDRIGEGVAALPVEIVPRQGQEQLLLAVRVLDPKVGRHRAVVRVGERRIEQRIVWERHIGRLLVVAVAGGNRQGGVDHHHRMHDLLGRLVVEIEGDLAGIDRFLAERRVVRLEADRAPGRKIGARVVGHDVGLSAHRIARAQRRGPFGFRRPTVGRHLGHPAGQQVVNALAGTGLDGCGAHPAALGQRVGHGRPLIVHNARRRDGVGRNRDDGVRLAQRPFLGHVLGGAQRVRPVAARRAGFDPVNQGLGLFRRQALVVREFSNVRIRVVGRHAVRADHLTDHRREALHRGVVRHCERPDAAFFVAGHALGFEDRRHILGIGNLGHPTGGEGDLCAGNGRRGGGHRLT